MTALGNLRAPEAVPALIHATQWVPDYLDFDEARALATMLRETAIEVLKYRDELLES